MGFVFDFFEESESFDAFVNMWHLSLNLFTFSQFVDQF